MRTISQLPRTRASLGVLAVFVALMAIPAATQRGAGNEPVRVEGGLISGTTEDGGRAYKGIPYAAPPVGDLRWKPPQPVVAWTGVRSSDTIGAACPHLARAAAGFLAEVTEPKREDCLFLNVWTAARPGDRRPVMVWYHGGGWRSGSGTLYTPNGAPLAKKGVVLVTVNYRLGPLGFLAHPELTAESPHHSSGNYGFLDQIAALQWVRQNIAAFGGDPGRVTIFGESAGSWTVSVLMASPLAKGLFHRAIGESGGRFARQPHLTEDRDGVQSAERNGIAFAKAAGADSIKELRAIPADTLLKVPGYRTEETIDGWVLPREVRATFADGQYNAVPLIVGSNADESVGAPPPVTVEAYRKRVETEYGARVNDYYAVYPVDKESDLRNAQRVGGHRTFNLPMRTWARLATAAGRSKTFMYYFSHVPPHPAKDQLGAYHTGEIPYVFNDLGQHTWAFQPHDYRLADLMSSYWVQFATSGDPNGGRRPQWVPFDLRNEPYLEFGDTVAVRHHLLKPQLDFIEQVQQRRSTSD
jgi:para-nitrobenzyl esterase